MPQAAPLAPPAAATPGEPAPSPEAAAAAPAPRARAIAATTATRTTTTTTTSTASTETAVSLTNVARRPAPAPATVTADAATASHLDTPPVVNRVEITGSSIHRTPSAWPDGLGDAARRGDLAALDRLLPGAPAHPGGVDAEDDQGHTALWTAVQARQAGSVRRLLQAGADPSHRGAAGIDTPLELARRAGPADVRTLLEAAATPAH